MSPIIFSFPGNESLTNALAGNLNWQVGEMTLRHFPDGESYVRVQTPVQQQPVILVATLAHPDDKILPLLFLARTVKDLGASKIALIAPYLAYLRQDRRFQAGEGLSSQYFADLLSPHFDWLVTIDPHLHRYHALDEIYSIPTQVLHATTCIAEWIHKHLTDPVLVGPDSESEQWVSKVAKKNSCPYIVLEKIRSGDRDVKVSVPDLDKWRHATPVLIDDIISTGRTMIETVTHLKRLGMKPPVCIGVHAVFAPEAYEALLAAGASKVVTCNTIPHVSNEIDVQDILTQAAKEMEANSR